MNIKNIFLVIAASAFISACSDGDTQSFSEALEQVAPGSEQVDYNMAKFDPRMADYEGQGWWSTNKDGTQILVVPITNETVGEAVEICFTWDNQQAVDQVTCTPAEAVRMVDANYVVPVVDGPTYFCKGQLLAVDVDGNKTIVDVTQFDGGGLDDYIHDTYQSWGVTDADTKSAESPVGGCGIVPFLGQ